LVVESSTLKNRLREGLAEDFGSTVATQTLMAHDRLLSRHGDLDRWREGLAGLPRTEQGWEIVQGLLKAGAASDDPATMAGQLKAFIPWRKGPLELAGVPIDTEWRSNLKWDRLANHVDLEGKHILDVGAGNAYFGWRMLEAGARRVIGCDPTQLFVIQHEAISHFAGPAENHLLALRLEDMPAEISGFDTVFSMGVLYHRRDHLAHLRDLAARLAPAGELVLETLVIPGKGRKVLAPEGRYANMRNVHALPTVPELENWLKQAGYTDIVCLDVTPTTSQEQRRTEWMPFHSLTEALDPNDPGKTREGHPAPTRAIILAHCQ
jgi:tRNA (mo5U34)-methyltransferase